MSLSSLHLFPCTSCMAAKASLWLKSKVFRDFARPFCWWNLHGSCLLKISELPHFILVFQCFSLIFTGHPPGFWQTSSTLWGWSSRAIPGRGQVRLPHPSTTLRELSGGTDGGHRPHAAEGGADYTHWIGLREVFFQETIGNSHEIWEKKSGNPLVN